MDEILQAILGQKEESPPDFKTPNVNMRDPVQARIDEIRARQEQENPEMLLMNLLMDYEMNPRNAQPYAPSGTPKGYPGHGRDKSMDGDY